MLGGTLSKLRIGEQSGAFNALAGRLSEEARLADADTLVLASVGETTVAGYATRGMNVIHNNLAADRTPTVDDSLTLFRDQSNLVGIKDGQLSLVVGNRVQIDPPTSRSFLEGGVGDLTFREWSRILKPGGKLKVSIANAKPSDVIEALQRAGFTNVQQLPGISYPSSFWYSANR